MKKLECSCIQPRYNKSKTFCNSLINYQNKIKPLKVIFSNKDNKVNIWRFNYYINYV